MKKLCYVICLMSLMACNRKTADKTADINKNPSSEKYTLNGILQSDADSMVRAFQKDSLSSGPTTAIWFSEKFIDAVFTTIEVEEKKDPSIKFDGVRIYYAKKSGKNSVIMVLTTYGGPSLKYEKKTIHNDFFTESSPILNSVWVRNVDEHTPAIGANLYSSTRCETPECKTDEHYVSCTTAQQWVKEFKTFYHKDPKINSLGIWYDIGLFHKIKDELNQGREQDKKGDGFRVYFVKNDSTRHSFILVPTLELPNGDHLDDYACYLNFFSPNDRGEECPVFCEGTTWPPKPKPPLPSLTKTKN